MLHIFVLMIRCTTFSVISFTFNILVYRYSFRLDRIMSAYFDVVFCAQKIFAEKLCDDTGRRVDWLPLACYPAFMGQEQIYDLAFIGSLDKRRLGIKNLLERAGLKTFWSI